MLYLAITSLFVLATTALYVLIKYSKQHIGVFLIIPLLIGSSLLSYTAFKVLEGAPIRGYPPGNFTVITATPMKPDILITVKHEEGDIKTYFIPFNNSNAMQMNREKNLVQNGVARKGSFQKNKFGEMRYIVDMGDKTPLPPKNTPPNQQATSNTGSR